MPPLFINSFSFALHWRSVVQRHLAIVYFGIRCQRKKKKKRGGNIDVIKQVRRADRCLPDRVHRRRSAVGIQLVLKDVLVSQAGREVQVANRFAMCTDCWSECWDPCWPFPIATHSFLSSPTFLFPPQHLCFRPSGSQLCGFQQVEMLPAAEAFNVDLYQIKPKQRCCSWPTSMSFHLNSQPTVFVL